MLSTKQAQSQVEKQDGQEEEEEENTSQEQTVGGYNLTQDMDNEMILDSISEKGGWKPYDYQLFLETKQSKIENIAILSDSYFNSDQQQFRNAIHQRLLDNKQQYPLDLISLMKWDRLKGAIAHRKQFLGLLNQYDNRFTVALYSQHILQEGGWKNVIDPSYILKLLDYDNDFGMNVIQFLKSQTKQSTKHIFNSKLTFKILQKVLLGEVDIQTLNFLKCLDIQNVNISFENPNDIVTLLQIQLDQTEMSNLQYIYIFVKITPGAHTSVNLDKFIRLLYQISFTPQSDYKFKNELSDIINSKYNNHPLVYKLLAEIFFKSSSFALALRNTIAMISLLSRIASKNPRKYSSYLFTLLNAGQPLRWDLFEHYIPYQVLKQIQPQYTDCYLQIFEAFKKQANLQTGYFSPENYFDYGLLKPKMQIYINGIKVEQIIEPLKRINLVKFQRPLKAQFFGQIVRNLKSIYDVDSIEGGIEQLKKREQILNQLIRLRQQDRNELDLILLGLRVSQSDLFKIYQLKTQKKQDILLQNLSFRVKQLVRMSHKHQYDFILNNILSGNIVYIQQYFQMIAKQNSDSYKNYLQYKTEILEDPKFKKLLQNIQDQWQKKQKQALWVFANTQHLFIENMDPVYLRNIFQTTYEKAKQRKQAFLKRIQRQQSKLGGVAEEGLLLEEGQNAPHKGEEELIGELQEGSEKGQQVPVQVLEAIISQQSPAQEVKPVKKKNLNRASFSTIKQINTKYSLEKPIQSSGFEIYLNTLKDVDDALKKESELKLKFQRLQQIVGEINSSISIAEAREKVLKAFSKNNESSKFLDELVNLSKIKYFIDGKKLLIGFFFFGNNNKQSTTSDVSFSPRLIANFSSTLGPIQRDYNKYIDLVNTSFSFGLSTACYNIILESLKRQFSRAHFKKCIAHIIQYKSQIDKQLIQKITSLCDQEKMGMTLLQFANLIIINSIKISEYEFKCIVDGLKNYKGICDDIPQLYKALVQKYKWEPEPEIIDGYFEILAKSARFDDITKTIKVIRDLETFKKHKFKEGISSAQNQKLEQQSKQIVKQKMKKLLRKLIIVCTKYADIKNAQLLFQEYIEKQKISSKDLSLAYMSYSYNPKKFKEVIELQKAEQTITNEQFDSLLRAFQISPRTLSDDLGFAMQLFLYQRKIPLTKEHIFRISNIFRRSQNALVFSKFLQHLLRIQPELNIEVKKLFFKILNLAKDDATKNYLKGMLDLLFEKEKKDQKLKFKQTWKIEQQKKNQLDKIKKQALDKIQKRKQQETREQIELLKKHGLLKQDKLIDKKQTKKDFPKASGQTNLVAQPQAEGSKQVQNKQNKKSIQKNQSKIKENKKQSQKEKNQKEDKPSQNINKIAHRPINERNIIEMQEVKKISNKANRRGGRDKFTDSALYEEQMDDEPQSKSRQKRQKKVKISQDDF